MTRRINEPPRSDVSDVARRGVWGYFIAASVSYAHDLMKVNSVDGRV